MDIYGTIVFLLVVAWIGFLSYLDDFDSGPHY